MRITTAVVSLLFAGGLIVSAGAADNPETTTDTTTSDTTVADTTTSTTTTRTETTTSTTNSDAISCPPGTTAVRVREDSTTTSRSADSTAAATEDRSTIEMDTIGAGGAPRLRRVEEGDAATTSGSTTSSTTAEMSGGADLSTESTTTVRTRTTYQEDYRLGDRSGASRGVDRSRVAATSYDRSRGVGDLGGAGMARDVGARRAARWRGGYSRTGVDLAGLSLLSSLLLTAGLVVRRRPR